jgi:tricorn protease
VFDDSGKYLYFLGSTNAGPVKEWFALSNQDMRLTSSLYLAVLRNNLPNPLAKESDEEKGVQKEEKPKEAPKAPEPFSIDFEGLNNRILSLPLPTRNYGNLQAGTAGQFYYIESPEDDNPVPGGPERSVLHQYDLNKRKDDSFINGVSDYIVSGDKKKILYRSNAAWSIVEAIRRRSCTVATLPGLLSRSRPNPSPAPAGSTSTTLKCASIRARSGTKSSMKHGASIVISFMRRICTARTGMR